jgi:hypothetical protein
LLGAFLAEASESVASRVVDDALLEVDHTPQRRAVRLPWRFLDMNNGLRLAIGGAALAVVFAGGLYLFGSVVDVGGPVVSPTPTLASTPSARAATPATQPDETAIEGSWQACPTEQELLAAGVGSAEAAESAGCTTIAFDLGTLGGPLGAFGEAGAAAATDAWGSYSVSGETLSIRRSGGATLAFTWVVRGDTLTLAPAPSGDGAISPVPFTAVPWGRTSAADGIWMPFASQQNVYSGRMPAGWTAAYADRPWEPDSWAAGEAGPNVDGADVFTAPDGSVIVVASQELGEGMTEEAWYPAYIAGTQGRTGGSCWRNPVRPPFEIDGQPATLYGGSSECHFTEAVTFANGRAYVVIGYPAPPSGGVGGGRVFDRAVLDTFLSWFRLDPTAAFEPIGASPSP